MGKMTIDNKLGLDKFKVDELHSHIEADQTCTDQAELQKLLLACPAHLYELDEAGKLTFSYEGCLECGTCRVLSGGRIVRRWDYPANGCGVEYRQS